MTRIEARYRIVSPMFIGDAEQKATCIRPPSFKGALRFWWRALALGRFGGKLEDVHREESRIFGNAADESKGYGQGLFLMSVQVTRKGDDGKWKPDKGHGYLLGLGLFHYKNGLQRNYIPRGTEFLVNLTFKPGVDDKDVAHVKDALIVLGLLGGLGSRSRRGLGSINLMELSVNGNTEKVWKRPTTEKALSDSIKEYCNSGLSPGLPAYTAVSVNTRIDISQTDSDSMRLLNSVGEQMLKYRSFRTKPCKYRDDHDNAMNTALGIRNKVFAHPRRIVFGLPHNYFSGNWGKVDVGPTHKDASGSYTSVGRSRRASPLLLHVHELTGNYCMVQSLIPAVFLPSNDKVQMSSTKQTLRFLPSPDYAEITGYMDGFVGRVTI